MEDEKEICELKIKTTKKVCGLHLMYIVIICAILILINILIIPERISDVAFQNFSFASTVVSIVLAVVSIIYSLWSGKSSNSQYDSIRHIEKQIDNQLENFTKIEKSIVANINPIRDQMQLLKDDQTKTNSMIDNFMSMYSTNGQSSTKATDKFDNESNTDWGALTLYACQKSHETAQPVPRDILEKVTGSYWSGYMVALSKIMPEKMAYKFQDPKVFIKKFDESYWGTEKDFLKRINDKWPNEIKEINQYFGTGG